MQRCEIFVGKVVSHPCGAGAVRRCRTCDRPTCERHLASLEGETLTECLECAGKYKAPTARTRVERDELEAFTDEEFAIFDEFADAADFALMAYDS